MDSPLIRSVCACVCVWGGGGVFVINMHGVRLIFIVTNGYR